MGGLLRMPAGRVRGIDERCCNINTLDIRAVSPVLERVEKASAEPVFVAFTKPVDGMDSSAFIAVTVSEASIMHSLVSISRF